MENFIRNVYCIGRNYKLHALELGNDLPTEPMVFLKPTHAVKQLGNETEITLPLHKGAVHHELEIVLQIGREVKAGMTADEVVSSFTLGIDFTLRDVQEVLKKKGHPWTAAKAVLQSGPVAPFQTYPGMDVLTSTTFTMLRNGNIVQSGVASDMIFQLDQLISYLAANYGLGEGDMIFTGTPAGVGPIEVGDVLTLVWGTETLASCKIQAAPQ